MPLEAPVTTARGRPGAASVVAKGVLLALGVRPTVGGRARARARSVASAELGVGAHGEAAEVVQEHRPALGHALAECLPSFTVAVEVAVVDLHARLPVAQRDEAHLHLARAVEVGL